MLFAHSKVVGFSWRCACFICGVPGRAHRASRGRPASSRRKQFHVGLDDARLGCCCARCRWSGIHTGDAAATRRGRANLLMAGLGSLALLRVVGVRLVFPMTGSTDHALQSVSAGTANHHDQPAVSAPAEAPLLPTGEGRPCGQPSGITVQPGGQPRARTERKCHLDRRAPLLYGPRSTTAG